MKFRFREGTEMLSDPQHTECKITLATKVPNLPNGCLPILPAATANTILRRSLAMSDLGLSRSPQ